MAAKSSAFGNDLLKFFYNAVAIANLADNAASSPKTSLYVALHTATPGVGGDQTTNECAYTSYARVAVVRTSSGWTVTGASVSPVADIDFPIATGGSETVTHFSVGVAASSTSKILHFGTVTPNIVITTGVTPVLTTATAITES